ncbi:uncharacterized protein LOC136077877 [Hydra vulgaris]|uniref:Uncharacterized protein LOC136077877 n=1 Tax=Hydra vulgaris TaxID=6087 RepID=A0ABM4BGN3_HYDVU
MSEYKKHETVSDLKGTNIFEGEASESDDEYSGVNSNIKHTESKLESKVPESPGSTAFSGGVVVSGEASESDDDIDDYMISDQSGHEFEISNGMTISLEIKKPKFESLFHKKLWEKNFSFRHGIVEHQLEHYASLVNKLKAFIPLSNRSQNFAQDALKDYRVISSLTKHLNDNLENVLGQVNIPILVEDVSLC